MGAIKTILGSLSRAEAWLMANAWRRAAFEIGLIFVVFAIYAGWPVPDVNEAHYLAKAKHYWNPDWCHGDLFLESADAHQVFYWTFGWLTLVLPLAAVAIIGRIVTWLLLAWSWRRLHLAISPGCRGPIIVVSATLLVFFSDITQMAGEWIVGGVEAKGFAFVMLFLALESLVLGRWNRVWLLLGGAAAFHVLVGGWATVACFGVWIAQRKDRPALRTMWPGLVAGALFAAPSVWFGLRLSAGVDPADFQEANRIQFVERISHHLNPFAFKTGTVILQFGLFAAYLGICVSMRAPQGAQRLQRFVACSGGIALCGCLIAFVLKSNPVVAASVLRFYWFRLFDVALPIGLALLPITILEMPPIDSEGRPTEWYPPRRLHMVLLIGSILLAPCALFFLAYQKGTSNMNVPRADKFVTNETDWREACRWAAENTEPHDLFLVPGRVGTFKFYAGRSDVVNAKDMPQDAASLVEWWRRMLEFQANPDFDPADPASLRWRISLGTLGTERLRHVAANYGVRYVIVVTDWPEKSKDFELPPLDLELVHHNAHYAVYRFSQTK